MQTREIALTVDGSRMDVAFATPDGPGPFPTALVCHHRGGIDEFTNDVLKRLSAIGIAAAAPNFYHRRPRGEDPLVSVKTLQDGELVADINAALAHLKTMPLVDKHRIGTVGHCLGGRISYLALIHDPIFMAAVLLYHGNILESRGANMPAPFDLTGNIRCPVLGLFGRDDPNPSPEMTARLSAAFARHGIRHEFHSYDGAGHAFQDPRGDKYRQGPADDAWVRLLAFLRREMVDKQPARVR